MTHRPTEDAASDVEGRPSTLSLGRGWTASWAPDGTGDYWPWLVNLSATCARVDGCACPSCARHEQDGPLPAAVTRRLAMTTRTGNPAANERQEGTTP